VVGGRIWSKLVRLRSSSQLVYSGHCCRRSILASGPRSEGLEWDQLRSSKQTSKQATWAEQAQLSFCLLVSSFVVGEKLALLGQRWRLRKDWSSWSTQTWMPRLLKGDYCRSRRRCSSSHRGFHAMCSKELVESIFFFMSIKMCNWAPGGIRKQQQEVLLVLRAPVPPASPSAHCRCRETPSIAWVKVETLWNLNLNLNLNLLNSLGSFSPASVSEVPES